MKRSLMRSTGRYLSSRLITNDYLSRFMDTRDEGMRQQTEMDQRYWIPEEERMGALDLATHSVRGTAIQRRAVFPLPWMKP